MLIITFLALYSPSCLLEASSDSTGIFSIKVNEYNFGRILENGGNVRHRFTFNNAGNAPFSITNIRTTCGCTVPRWSRDQILPGDEGFFEIELNPSGISGPFQKTIQIQSTAMNSNMFVTISGSVIKPPHIEDLSVKLGDLNIKTNQVNFGYIYKGQSRIQNIFFVNNSDNSVEIDFKNDKPYLNLKAFPGIVEPGNYGQIEVVFNSQVSDVWDMCIDEIPVILNQKESKNMQLIIMANIREDFRYLTPEHILNKPVAIFEKDTFDYGIITSLHPVNCQFKIENGGNSDLIIRAVKSSCGCTVVLPEKDTLRPGELTFIDATFKPGDQTGVFKYAITVISNDPDTYKKLLFIKGHIKQ